MDFNDQYYYLQMASVRRSDHQALSTPNDSLTRFNQKIANRYKAGLGLAYFLVPKVIGRPIYSYYLAAFGFWSLALFSPWNAGSQLVGAPIPAWIITAGIASTFLMLIPVWVVGFNFHKTLEGNYALAGSSPTLKFVMFGLIAYIVGQVVLASTSFRGISYVAQSTVFSYATFNLMFYAFFSFIMFGAIYYITPRLVGCEWISSRLIKWHFMLTAYAIGIVILMWAAGGFIHGGAIGYTAVSAYFSDYKSVVESVNLLVRSPLPLMLLLPLERLSIPHHDDDCDISLL